MAGDLTSNADRKEIVVWREENNERKEYQVDLTSKSIFSSPVFLVKQNDLIFIRPNKTGLTQPTLLRSTGPVAVSIVSLILTTMLFFYR
jgi:polysaccharide export outer membrane protein